MGGEREARGVTKHRTRGGEMLPTLVVNGKLGKGLGTRLPIPFNISLDKRASCHTASLATQHQTSAAALGWQRDEDHYLLHEKQQCITYLLRLHHK